MIYLVGGPVRVGKSRLARLVLRRRGIASISTDALTTAIGRELPKTRLAGRSIPQEEWENNFYPFLRRFLKNIQIDYPDFLVEGAVISPCIAEHLSRKFPIQACFLGKSSTDVQDLVEHMGSNVWLRQASPDELCLFPDRITRRSYFLEAECLRLGFPYIDLVGNYEERLDLAFETLLSLGHPSHSPPSGCKSRSV